MFGRADGVVGKLGVALGSPVKASLASFVVGLISLAIVVAFVDRTYSLGDALKKGNPWWMWAGGLLGATLVMCNAYLSAHIGTGMTVMSAEDCWSTVSACLACHASPWPASNTSACS